MPRTAVIAAILVTLAPLARAEKAREAAPAVARLELRRGVPVVVDGVVSDKEWDDATEVRIEAEPGWPVVVRGKHDGANIALLFSGLRHGPSDERYAEALVDAAHGRARHWRPGTWWLHASYNDCEADGAHDVYEKDGKGQCSRTKDGWTANNFPLADPPVVEMTISFAKLGLKLGSVIGLALDVTDTRSRWSFWPEAAKLDHPSTWGEAVIMDAPAPTGPPFAPASVRSGEPPVENAEARELWYVPEAKRPAASAQIVGIKWDGDPGINLLNATTRTVRVSLAFKAWVRVEAGATGRLPAVAGQAPIIVTDDQGHEISRLELLLGISPTGLAVAPP